MNDTIWYTVVLMPRLREVINFLGDVIHRFRGHNSGVYVLRELISSFYTPACRFFILCKGYLRHSVNDD